MSLFPNPARVPTQLRRLPLLHLRHRSARRGAVTEAPLVDLFGERHRVRSAERGAPCFSTLVQLAGDAVARHYALVLAFDLDADDAFVLDRLLRGRAFVMWTAFDHRDADGRYRFRVLLPLSRPVGSWDLRVLREAVHGELGSLADRRAEPKDHRWTLPCAPRERAELATIHYGQGAVVDVDAMLGTSVHAEGLGDAVGGAA